MKYLLILPFLVLSALQTAPALAQVRNLRPDYLKLYKSVLDEYGFDQVLVNGISYEDKYQPKEGHQFFPDDQLHKGTLTFRGKEYKGLDMMYDICDQQLILVVKQKNVTARIIPSNDFISAFSIGDRVFSKYNFQNEPGFYQVVFDTEKIKCLYSWSKEAVETGNIGNYIYYHYEFTDSKRKSYLKLDGQFEKYSNNRSFTELFPAEIRVKVRKYLKTNHINVVKSSDKIIREVLSYCTSLI